jgi:integrase/recombinase XerD
MTAAMASDMTLGDAITALVAEKRAVGYKYTAEAKLLARFEAFCREQFPGLVTPTQVSVEAWISSARQRGVTPSTLQGLVAPVRELARWLGRRGVHAYVLPAGVLPQAGPLHPVHLHRPGTGSPVRPNR